MPFRLREAGSDTLIEAEAPDLGSVLVEVARAFTHITTSGDRLSAHEHVTIVVHTPGDPGRLLVAYVDELVFLFATRGFLPVDGDLRVTLEPKGGRVEGRLGGERFDPARHRLGTEVKAATFHAARLAATPKGASASVMVDL